MVYDINMYKEFLQKPWPLGQIYLKSFKVVQFPRKHLPKVIKFLGRSWAGSSRPPQFYTFICHKKRYLENLSKHFK
jgi:hypothetical protein